MLLLVSGVCAVLTVSVMLVISKTSFMRHLPEHTYVLGASFICTMLCGAGALLGGEAFNRYTGWGPRLPSGLLTAGQGFFFVIFAIVLVVELKGPKKRSADS